MAERESVSAERASSRQVSATQVAAKTEELTRDLAKATGVDVEDVAKVLQRLGLDSAVASQLERVNIDRMRISLGPVPI